MAFCLCAFMGKDVRGRESDTDGAHTLNQLIEFPRAALLVVSTYRLKTLR